MIINETLIEKYFSKQLSEAELLEFKKQYEINQDFKAEVDFLKNVRSVSEMEDDVEFKNRLTSYETEFLRKEESASPKWLKPLVAMAAIAVIGLSITFFINQDINTDQLFSTYFEPSKNVSAPIVRSESDDQLINKAFISYSEADYNQAVPLFERVFENTKNSELLFYKGNALLAMDKTDEAIVVFKKHLSYSDALTNRTHWYLALAYIKSQQIDNAKAELNTLINSGESFKKEKAKSLLKKLD